jgi:hypothetical protein
MAFLSRKGGAAPAPHWADSREWAGRRREGRVVAEATQAAHVMAHDERVDRLPHPRVDAADDVAGARRS